MVTAPGQDGVSFRADTEALRCLLMQRLHGSLVQAAGEKDFDTEWLSLVLGIKVVDGLEEAMAHIAAHSTGHSDGILTNEPEHARAFVNAVNSAAVYVNASTRFTDGSQLGLGAEVAVSTQRLHARGPMGLRELTTYKWVIEGDYHIRANNLAGLRDVGYNKVRSGRGSARLECTVRDREVGGSNPSAPTR